MLNNTIKINNTIINAYNDVCEDLNLISITSYRNCLLETMTFFKLSSVYNCDSAIDALAIDSIENEYRFTIIYNIQSSSLNYSLRLITKTKDGLALLSVQNIYPAFN
jgi:NADH:ubiquinone oxidoreductase subunit C